MARDNRTAARSLPLALAVVFVVGVVVGLTVFGWWLLPVKWVNAGPGNLSASFKQEYIVLVADSLAMTGNVEVARQRIEYLGDTWPADLQDAVQNTSGQDNIRVAALQATLMQSLILSGAAPGETAPAAEAAPPSLLSRVARFLIPACLGLLFVGLLVGGVLYLRQVRGAAPRRPAGAGGSATTVPAARVSPTSASGLSDALRPSPQALVQESAEPAIARFMTTYTLGDDLYDDSFSIDSPSGDFLGECGVGISETIGVGDPKKVAALEVWLFDKNDIRTVTRVLMSEHIFKDDGLKSRLAAKGEPVLARVGEIVKMETASLTVNARVVDLAYGGGALPPNSYFERITVELQCWQRAAGA